MIKKLLGLSLLAIGLFAQGTIHPRQIRSGGATNGQALVWNGSSYVPTSIGAGGLHASSHQHGGLDEVATSTPTANAIPKAGAGGTLGIGWIPDLLSIYAALSHTHPASGIISGTFDNARIATSNVTQHQASLVIGWGQLSSIPSNVTNAHDITTSNDWTQIATPGTNPSAGFLRVYAKTGAGICWKNSAGTETCVSSGAGDVLGGSTSVDGELVAYNGTTGKLLKQSFAAFSGPASTVKTYTLPNQTATILTDAALVTLAQGGTSANLSSTGGANQILKQTSLGGAVTVALLADGDVPAAIARDSEINVQGTANEITSSGSGVAPTLSIASTFDLVGKTATRPIKRGVLAARPSTCTVGDMYWATDVTAGQNISGCTATDTWTTMGDGGAGGGFNPTENLQSGATYTLIAGDCGKRVVLSHATPVVTVPAASGFSDGCTIQLQPISGDATLQTGVSATVYRNQTAWITSNASVWRLDYFQFTNSPSGAVTIIRDTAGVTIPELDQTINYNFSGENILNVGGTGNLRFSGTNNAAGTLANRLAKLAASNTLTVMGASDTDEPLGVCISGCGNVGTAIIVFRGNVSCEADNAVSPNDWLSIGTSTVGRCKSEGATEPTSGWILGRARTGASAGSLFTAYLAPRKVTAGAAGAPTDATYITQTSNAGLSAEQALGALASGLMRNTTTSGVVTIAKADEITTALYCADAGGTDSYACSLTPAITGYVTGAHYRFKANTANTGTATLNLNSLGAITIKKFTSASPGADLSDNDIRANQVVDVVYDGTNMQMVSTLGNVGGLGPNDVTATSTFANDNRAIRSDGPDRGAQTSGVTIDDSANISTAGTVTAASFSGGGTTEGNLTLTEASGNGSNFRRLSVPAALTADLTLRYPNTVPAGSVLLWPAPTADVSEATFTSPVSLGGALYCADAGSNDTYACSLSPAITSYVAGTHYFFKANTVNTGAATINFNSVGATTIKKFTSASPGADLADNDIRAGQIVEVVYDGTNMQMVSLLGNAGGSAAFSALTGGTNTGAAMIVGAGASHRANAADATAPSKSGTSLPGSCTVGDTYIKTDNPTPIQLYLCTATNTWTVQGDDIFDFTTMRVQERFCGSSNSGGPTTDVGQYRWTSVAIAGTSTLTLAADSNHPCYWQIVTGATSGNGTYVKPSFYASQHVFDFAYGNDGTWEMRLVAQIDTIADTDFAFGIGGGDLVAGTQNMIRTKRLAGGSTFIFEACDNSFVCSSSNSTITPSNGTTFTIRMRSTTAGTILFSVNGETEVSRSANIPTAASRPNVTIKTATSATRQLRLFGWAFQKTGMTP